MFLVPLSGCHWEPCDFRSLGVQLSSRMAARDILRSRTSAWIPDHLSYPTNCTFPYLQEHTPSPMLNSWVFCPLVHNWPLDDKKDPSNLWQNNVFPKTCPNRWAPKTPGSQSRGSCSRTPGVQPPVAQHGESVLCSEQEAVKSVDFWYLQLWGNISNAWRYF